MRSESVDSGAEIPFAGHLDVKKMPAHWLMARLGKRVLRPGGVGATRWLIGQLGVGAGDDVIELAPGLGTTARALLALGPKSYAGVERDAGAADFARRAIGAGAATPVVIHQSDASAIPVEAATASVVFGEAVLSIQPEKKKEAIVAEAARVLRPGGRYAIHELAVTDIAGETAEATAARLDAVQKELSASIHVGVRIGRVSEWRALLEQAGFEVEAVSTYPMRLLEIDRFVQDEGVWGSVRFTVNMLRTSGATGRLWNVYKSFRRRRADLCAVAMVAKKR